MSKPPKIVIPGLNRGAGVPAGFVVGRRRATGRGPAELLDLNQMRGAGVQLASAGAQQTSSAISSGMSSISSLSTSIATSVSTALLGYLPLTGGTLTGPVTGTTFFADGFDLFAGSPGNYGMFRSGTDVLLKAAGGFEIDTPFPSLKAGIEVRFYAAGNWVGRVDTLGYDLPNGGGYRVLGTQIITTQQSGVADATNPGDVTGQLNDLLAKLRTHGIIAAGGAAGPTVNTWIWAPTVDGSNPPVFILDGSNQLIMTRIA